jgi:hypothetical protein
VNLGSSVTKVAGYAQDDRAFGSRQGQGFFLCTVVMSRSAVACTQSAIQRAPWTFTSVREKPRSKIDSWSPFNVNVKNAWIFSTTPQVHLWCARHKKNSFFWVAEFLLHRLVCIIMAKDDSTCLSKETIMINFKASFRICLERLRNSFSCRLYVWSKAFTARDVNKISGYQAYQWLKITDDSGSVCPYYQGYDVTMCPYRPAYLPRAHVPFEHGLWALCRHSIRSSSEYEARMLLTAPIRSVAAEDPGTFFKISHLSLYNQSIWNIIVNWIKKQAIGPELRSWQLVFSRRWWSAHCKLHNGPRVHPASYPVSRRNSDIKYRW